ncbi:MAG: hypothetical protein JSU86_19695 [Phycisphaerales bacterium]|nr:MAG: hypothetical protein JSU86_19695 [Phycisphaerales bacterium]
MRPCSGSASLGKQELVISRINVADAHSAIGRNCKAAELAHVGASDTHRHFRFPGLPLPIGALGELEVPVRLVVIGNADGCIWEYPYAAIVPDVAGCVDRLNNPLSKGTRAR